MLPPRMPINLYSGKIRSRIGSVPSIAIIRRHLRTKHRRHVPAGESFGLRLSPFVPPEIQIQN